MKEYVKEVAIDWMNKKGQEETPFLFIIDYKQQRIKLATLDQVNPTEVLYNLNGFSNVSEKLREQRVPLKREEIEWNPQYPTFEEYNRSFQVVASHIQAGDSCLVNLTCATSVHTNLSFLDMYHHSKALYKMWVKDEFVVFSPEIFVRMRDGFVYSYPMKGTIDATLPDAREQILTNPKEAAEHASVVELIREDLSRISDEIDVPRYRYIDELMTNKGPLLEVSSEVRGRLPEDWKAHLGDFLMALLPAGSITGAPKDQTVAIIEEAENYDRGYYCGVMGYFDGKQLDSSVMIRFMDQQPDGTFVFKSGGGVTGQSNVESEYNEVKQKVYVPIY